ncbi:electron transfer flavoprotein subunit beta/FixA family protein [Devosia sp.]|uniref:electron transfer flavoprotein subunit beta/FixA family protein n=1 Tax=Devosia sp. TaxID=1871048 RepID=UPI002EFA5A78
MRILVPVKRVVDVNVRVRIRPDNAGVDLAAAKMALNPFDEIALEEALRLKEQGHASEVVAVSAGAKPTQDVLRTPLAMGADRAIHVDVAGSLEPLGVAKLLRSVALEEDASLVIMGKQSVDDEAGQVGQMLAALLDWPQATFACGVAVEGTAVVVTREVDGGTQVVKLPLPAVVTADLRLNEPRYASLPNIMRAKSKPLAIRPASAFNVDLTPRLAVLEVREPAGRPRGRVVESVGELAGILKRAIGPN